MNFKKSYDFIHDTVTGMCHAVDQRTPAFVRPALAVAGFGLAGAAHAADPADALTAVQSLSNSSAGFGPVMFGLAVTAVGISIGIKWIKRARGAA